MQSHYRGTRLPLTWGSGLEPIPASPGAFVRVGRDVQKTVAFIGFENPSSPGGISCQGTGFFMVRENGAYFVTAAHVARVLEGSPFAIRVLRDDKAILMPFTTAEWTYHSDETVDVAAMPLILDREDGYKHQYLGPNVLVSEIDATTGNPDAFDVGDFCYTVGLFRHVYGEKINLPFVHVGNLAVVPPPGERIPVFNRRTDKVDLIEAYLIESKAIDGASGSPVFVRLGFASSPQRMSKGPPRVFQYPEDALRLLGLFQGAWFAPPDPTTTTIPRGSIVPVGIGIVVPTSKILEVLDMPKLKSARDSELRKNAAQQTAVSTVPPANGENPTHREDFMRLVGAAARKQEPED